MTWLSGALCIIKQVSKVIWQKAALCICVLVCEWICPMVTQTNIWFLGSTQVSPQTASRSVQPFFQGSPLNLQNPTLYNTFQLAGQPPKIASFRRDLDPI